MRCAGVLLHPTSLPSGNLGADARAFVDWLARANVRYWQVLPLVPPGAGDSPYSSQSAFALSPALIDLDALVRDGLLTTTDGAKGARLDEAALALRRSPLGRELEGYRAERPWVDDYALFTVLNRAHGRFQSWPAALRDRDPHALLEAKRAHEDAFLGQTALQMIAERQWQALRAYARERGVRIIGDVPIYVDLDSADVWRDRAAFQLDATGEPVAVSGVPPDYFSKDGQLWGNPLYDWPALAKRGHDFWVERMRRMYELYDVVRIDHFRAFSAYWSVPRGAKDAKGGKWVKGPGRAVFDDIKKRLGEPKVIAEDLGTLDDDVHSLRDATGFPGMRVLQFAFDGAPNNAYLPHNHVKNGVVYTGTHDNDTTLGWWRSLDERARDQVRRYYGIDAHDISWDLVRSALMSVADTAIVPMQDLLGLGGEARMNTPSAPEGNWRWRMAKDALRSDVADRFAALVTLFGRAPSFV